MEHNNAIFHKAYRLKFEFPLNYFQYMSVIIHDWFNLFLFGYKVLTDTDNTILIEISIRLKYLISMIHIIIKEMRLYRYTIQTESLVCNQSTLKKHLFFFDEKFVSKYDLKIEQYCIFKKCFKVVIYVKYYYIIIFFKHLQNYLLSLLSYEYSFNSTQNNNNFYLAEFLSCRQSLSFRWNNR